MSRVLRILPIVLFSTLGSVLICVAIAFLLPNFTIQPRFWLFAIGAPIVISTPASFYMVCQTERTEALSARLSAAYTEMKRMAEHDGLTGVLNRLAFTECVDRALESQRGWLVIADLDHFKSINDRYGHAVGDAVLVAAAGAIQGAVRGQDLIARMGGEEFAIFLPEIDRAGATARTERIRQDVAALRVSDGQGGAVCVTLCAGVAAIARPTQVVDALQSADKAMYAAKNAGRNRISLAA